MPFNHGMEYHICCRIPAHVNASIRINCRCTSQVAPAKVGVLANVFQKVLMFLKICQSLYPKMVYDLQCILHNLGNTPLCL